MASFVTYLLVSASCRSGYLFLKCINIVIRWRGNQISRRIAFAKRNVNSFRGKIGYRRREWNANFDSIQMRNPIPRPFLASSSADTDLSIGHTAKPSFFRNASPMPSTGSSPRISLDGKIHGRITHVCMYVYVCMYIHWCMWHTCLERFSRGQSL